jgi:type IV pilus assembly protein PilY1
MGKPIVTKRRDGTWVVVLTSGYNNINPGTGKGQVYVLEAHTGKLLDTIDTGEGDAAGPSGLSHLNAWVDNAIDNTALRFYGADLLGNLWRIDIDDLVPPAGREAVKLASFIRNSKSQPVTTRVELSEIRSGNTRIPVVTVGTGRQLGISDLGDVSVQSLYTIKDTLDEQVFGDVRSANLLVKREIVPGDQGERSVRGDPIDWSTRAGWYLDFDQTDTAGERVSIDPEQQLGVIRVVTNIPDSAVCRPVAQSWIYNLEYQTGLYVPTTQRSVAGRRIFSHALSAGARTIKVGERTISLVTSDHGNISVINHPAPGGGVPTVRRVSWQELDDQ